MTQHKAITTRLDIVGFKSFADEVHLDILPGLTGIVGPNGCGKSNIVEALRWTMGESSARALRGGDSDDLIFAGTGSRPARNLARVTLHLAEATGLAPAPFHQAGELEVSRQAERGTGSTYRINNRVMRARDVQTIFADLSSGARSSSIISQNRVSQLIAAKPEERRLLLEEAAGISGLYVRRRDAELKLRQAEANLERAEEHRQSLEQQLTTLARQSEKAQTYRAVSEEIRQHERSLLILQHARAEQLVQTRRTALDKAQETLTKNDAALKEAQEQLAQKTHSLQQKEDEHAALRPRLEQHRIHIEVTQASLQHQRQASEDHARQKAQLDEDIARLKEDLHRLDGQQKDTQQTLEDLTAQQHTLNAQNPTITEHIAALRTQETEQHTQLESASSQYHAGLLQQERLQSRQQALARQISDDCNTLDHLKAELKRLEDDCAQHTPTDDAAQHVADAITEAKQQDEQAHKAAEHFQEQRLITERAQRDVQEMRAHLQQLQQREEELTQRFTKQEARLTAEQAQAKQTQAALLDDHAKAALHQTQQTAQQAAHKAAEVEQALTKRRQEAEKRWLDEQAETEKQQQRRTSLQHDITRLAEQLKAQAARSATLQAALEDVHAKAIPHHALEEAQKNLASLEAQNTSQHNAIEETEAQLATHQQATQKAETLLRDIDTDLLRHKGEYEGLQQSLASSLKTIPHPVMEQLHIPEELTNALASALTDGLEASLPQADAPLADTPRQWCLLPDDGATLRPAPAIAALPCLAALINAPAPLSRALHAIFLLDAPEDGSDLQTQLQPGQSLVTKDGALWRWDGFIRQPNSPTAEMIRLQHVQKLKKTAHLIGKLTQDYNAQKQITTQSAHQCAVLEHTLEDLRDNYATMREDYAQQRHALEGLKQRHALHQDQLALINHEVQAHEAHIAQIKAEHHAAQEALTAHPPPKAEPSEAALTLKTLQAEEQAAREALEQARARAQEATTHQQQALFQDDARLTRLKEIEQNIVQLTQELEDITAQRHALEAERAKSDLPARQAFYEDAHSALQQAQSTAEATAKHAAEARQNATQLEQALQEKKRLLTGLQARRDGLVQHIQSSEATLATRQREERTCQAEQAALPDLSALKETVDRLTEHLNHTQEALRRAHGKRHALTQQLSLLKEREEHLNHTYQQANDRQNQLNMQLQDLTERQAALQKTASAQKDDDSLARHEQQLQRDSEALKQLEEQEQTLLATLAQARQHLQEQQTLLEHHQEGAHRYREDTIRLNERLAQAQEALALLQHETPLPDDAEAPETLSADTEQALRQTLKRANKRRDELGAVNLCAEEEFRTAQEEAERITKEHQDLSTAIARLRGGVGAINREGRQRLMAVFTDINTHFQTLFTRMFNGGQAHLQMVGSDDPLEAGLEIFAQPPGKKLSTLSLLSGGEQALTALSLIFAAFHCTPAPICVLDEVDAPLDDANVERFCTLLRDMTEQTKTRFLVITHHQLTMAHMDRLYGITMQERGVSRLLSVNLDESIRMVNG